jgi:glutaredoxin-related protein
MDTQKRIKEQVTGNRVVLYMKGTPQFPQCGFSALAVQVLNACGVNQFASVNVLADPAIRAGHQAVRQLADHPAALRQRRIRRRLGHHARDVRVGRAAEAARADQPERRNVSFTCPR